MNKNYDADNISMLNEIESVRQKYGMYIGDAGPNGLHHLIWEVLNNSADEALNGRGDTITGILHEDNYMEITDNGSGIPVGFNSKYNMNSLDMIMLYKHSGNKLNAQESSYKKSIGTNGLGLFILNCLSLHTIVTIKRDGKIYRAEYAVGKVKVPIKEIGKTKPGDTGTSIKWKYDPAVFSYPNISYDFDRIASRFKLTSFMVPKLKLILIDSRKKESRREEYYSERGLKDLLDDILIGHTKLLRNNIDISQSDNVTTQRIDIKSGLPVSVNLTIETEMCFNIDAVNREEIIKTYVNGNDTPLGGTMVTGFRNGYTKAINEYAREHGFLKDKDPDFKFNDIRDGLIACIHIMHQDPSFDSQTKTRLNSPEVTAITHKAIYDKMYRFGIDYPKEMDKIVDYYCRLRKGKASASKALDAELKKLTAPSTKTVNLSEFVTDCHSTNRKECELIIVEGRSALSSCKDARNALDQAVLPLKGKLINTYKGTLSKVLKNNEVQAIIKVLGTGSTQSNNFDMNKARYGRIIIMADADADGAHITLLVLTMIHEFLKPWIEEGRVYVGLLPLFTITTNKGEHYYYYNDDEFKEGVKNFNKKGTKIQTSRLKGLKASPELFRNK